MLTIVRDGVPIVILCAEQDDLSQQLVRIVHALVVSRTQVEVLTLDACTLFDEIARRPRAVFLLLSSQNLGRDGLDLVRDAIGPESPFGRRLVVQWIGSDAARIVSATLDVLEDAHAASELPLPFVIEHVVGECEYASAC